MLFEGEAHGGYEGLELLDDLPLDLLVLQRAKEDFAFELAQVLCLLLVDYLLSELGYGLPYAQIPQIQQHLILQIVILDILIHVDELVVLYEVLLDD